MPSSASEYVSPALSAVHPEPAQAGQSGSSTTPRVAAAEAIAPEGPTTLTAPPPSGTEIRTRERFAAAVEPGGGAISAGTAGAAVTE